VDGVQVIPLMERHVALLMLLIVLEHVTALNPMMIHQYLSLLIVVMIINSIVLVGVLDMYGIIKHSAAFKVH